MIQENLSFLTESLLSNPQSLKSLNNSDLQFLNDDSNQVSRLCMYSPENHIPMPMENLFTMEEIRFLDRMVSRANSVTVEFSKIEARAMKKALLSDTRVEESVLENLFIKSIGTTALRLFTAFDQLSR